MSIDLETPLTQEQIRQIIESIAEKIVERRLEVPAVLFLEMHKPLTFLASQATLVAMPFLGPILGAQRMADFARIMHDRENIDLLISRIEDMAAEKNTTTAAHQE